VASFWRHFDRAAGTADKGAGVVMPAGKGIEALVYTFEIKAYRVGNHEFRLLECEPVRPCLWNREDVIAAFRFSLPALRQVLVDVESSGFYSQPDIEESVKAMSDVRFNRLAGIEGKAGIIIELKRSDLSSPLEIKVFYAKNKDQFGNLAVPCVEFTFQRGSVREHIS
jgi:hypothetical protein